MTDLSACPFCGCGVKAWLNDAHTRCDWLCGSFKHGPEPYQFPDGACRGNELELEVDGWKAAHLDMSGDMLKVEADNAALLSRLEHQRAALLTPEGYRGVVAEALADEHERLEADNAALRGALSDCVDAMDGAHCDHYGNEWHAAHARGTAALSRPGGAVLRAAKALADAWLAMDAACEDMQFHIADCRACQGVEQGYDGDRCCDGSNMAGESGEACEAWEIAIVAYRAAIATEQEANADGS